MTSGDGCGEDRYGSDLQPHDGSYNGREVDDGYCDAVDDR